MSKLNTAAATATVLFLLITFPVFAQTYSLKSEIEQIIADKKAEIGVAICEIESKDTLNINGDARYRNKKTAVGYGLLLIDLANGSSLLSVETGQHKQE